MKVVGTITKRGKGAKQVGQPKIKIKCKLNVTEGVYTK